MKKAIVGSVLLVILLCVYLWSLGEVGTRGEEGSGVLVLLASFFFGVPGTYLTITGLVSKWREKQRDKMDGEAQGTAARNQPSQAVGRPARQRITTGKRIVSKSDYIAFRAKKSMMDAGIVGGCGVALMSLAVAIYLFFVGMSTLLEAMSSVGRNWHDSAQLGLSAAIYLGLVAFLCWGAYVMGKIGEKSLEQSANTEAVLPLTRANSADLPAPDSLVRASEEPKSEQEAVLLRAATEGRETASEQLVRAAGGTEL